MNENITHHGSTDPNFVPKKKDFRWNVIFDSQLLPVTTMFDMYGDRTNKPLHAFSCVCYIKGLKFTPGAVPEDAGDWLAITCKPGDVALAKYEPLRMLQ